MRLIGPVQLREWLHDGGEIAVLDVRDGGPYARSHILAASSAPLATFETTIPLLVPRRSTRIVLVDDDMSMVGHATALMQLGGYSNIFVLEGGNQRWDAEGFLLFSGSGIISKAFGELVEHERQTPHVDATTLADWQSRGVPHVLFDARPLAEYRTVSLPGATDCPGAELVYRVPAAVPNTEVPVVVNCAGRTRSIIGAQSLRDAGVPNPVYALKNGTMGWQLAGLDVVHGASNMVPEPDEPGRMKAQTLAAGILERTAIAMIDVEELSQLRADDTRTTYVFDVRQAGDFERGHLPGSVNIAGGQLVQATDSFVAVRNARIALVDEHGVHSVMTAHWLSQMGWEVVVVKDASVHMTETGSSPSLALCPPSPHVRGVTSADLDQLNRERPCIIVDVGESYWYRQGRIPGSWYSMRRGLADVLHDTPRRTTLVVVCGSGNIAPFAAGDVAALGFHDVRWLIGGRNAWKKAGLPTEVVGNVDDDLIKTPTDDMWYPPWARKDGVDEAMMQYLTWEIGLLENVAKETYVRFNLR